MKTILTRMFTVVVLMMISMAAWGQGEYVTVDIDKFDNGTITESQPQKQDGDQVIVTLNVEPQKGFSVLLSEIYIYETISPNMTRAGESPELGKRLYLDPPKGFEDKEITKATECTVTVDADGKFGVWVKEANFKERGSKGTEQQRDVVTDYSGTYYIASVGYDRNPANKNNFYLCPTEGWCSYKATDDFEAGDNMPFLTTFKCKSNGYHSGNASTAVWYVEKHPALNYYYIKQASTGRYLTSNGTINTTNNPDRMRVHLESVAQENLDDKELFTIEAYSTYLTISPKGVVGGAADRNWLTVNGGNVNNLKGASGKTGGPGTTGDEYQNTKGIIGVYTQGDSNAPFYLERAISIDPPAITNNFTAENTFTITAAEGATIYYTTDGTTPTTETTTTGTTSVNIKQTESMTVIKAIAKATGDNFPTPVITYILPVCERPAIKVSGGTVTITCSTADAAIHYTTNGDPATALSTTYAGPFAKGDATTIRAIATKTGYVTSSEAILLPPTEVSSSSQITNMHGSYILASNFTSSGSIGTADNPFKGIIDGNLYPLTLNYPLIDFAEDAIIKNVILDNVSISGNDNGNAGAICCEATGDTRIYNCGVLASSSTVTKDEDGYDKITLCSSSISGSNYVGSIVGLLDGSSRAINCFSYANVNGGSEAGGIVGHNNVATTASNLKTMVMNCMYYGEVSGTSIAPIYNGKIITNVGENIGVGNYNYFRLESSYIQNTEKTKVYNCALGAETRFLQRFEFFRHLLNSHRELAAWWATGSMDNKNEMMKWVLEPSQIGSSTPYPVLKAPDYYPSVVNIDTENAPLTSERNKGGMLGSLSVTIQSGSGAVYGAPTGASITKSSLTLNITDKDADHFNFNYYKVQLPYYNEVGTGNYTKNRVVTGWKIVSVTTDGSVTSYNDFTTGEDSPAYNFADRKCINKDLYSTSHRVFNQGAYWDVPEGVIAITIEPYWARCVYLADPNADKVYDTSMKNGYDVPNVGGGQIYTSGNSYSIAGDNQVVFTTMSNAISSSNGTGLFVGVDANSHTVYDYAVVLVGNYHHYGALEASNSKPYTVTSIDLDGDNEPDYSYILRFDSRTATHPVRVDFINIPGLGMAQKSTGGTGSYNFGIMQPKNWFESTNTSLFRVTQFEYDRSDRITAPYIVQGGVMEQWVSGQNNGAANNTTYFHVGGNVWFKEFHRGTHQDKALESKHPPVSVTGGDYDEFYLTGLYTANVANYEDNAECYINGGRFGTVAGAAMEGIGKANGADDTGNITWQVQNADIKEFFAGGINAAKPVTGNLNTTITGGKIDLFCGGPKFGDMSTGKTVITNATDCIFGTFFGAGYGGNSYSRQAPRNHNNLINFPHNDKDAGNDESWNSWLARFYTQSYNGTYGGVSTQFSYQFLPMSGNEDNCARIFVEYVKFSLATCRNVTSTLTGCKITGNFYGGGSLGKVDGPVTSTLTNCEVQGNAFGAGFSASLPPVEVDNIGFSTEPYYYTDLGTYRTGVKSGTVTYTWQKKNGDKWVDNTNHILYTTEDLTTLGNVMGNATLTINGTTTVGESVYGGGEESSVGGNTIVTVNSGSIGVKNKGGYRWGNVYGGGKGKIEIKSDGSSELAVSSIDDLDAGLVKGNTTVTINGTAETTKILHNVYGGGAVGSVGTFTRDANGMPTGCTSGGLATVTINGGTIGYDHADTGMVDGSSRGWEGDPNGTGAFAFLNQLAWVNKTNVTIGSSTSDEEDKGPTVYGSVYGGGENGHNFGNGVVTVNKGIVGYRSGTWDCGNIYGAGCGTDTFWRDDNGNGEEDEGESSHHNPMAGIVRGATTITVNGGHVLRNVYGGGSMGSVGTYTYTNGLPTTCEAGTGNATININGGIIGLSGTDYGHVFGGPRGDLNETEFSASVRETSVNINTGADVLGSVFGGGEAGIVKESVVVNMNGGEVTQDVYGGGALANTNTDNWGTDTWAAGKTAASNTTTINLKGGKVNRNVYGGALGQTEDTDSGLDDIEAKVYGNVLVELNNGVADDAKGCVVLGSIFGCNNLNGTPMGDVKVHIYKTQNDAASKIAGTDDGADENHQPKVADRYDVAAVYGGGNQSAYVPADLENNKTEVIIDGCDLTSIRQVYGGGNAACTPATNVTVNGTFEVEELFGGGNGLDNILINGVEMPNPGANVGYKNYSEYYLDGTTWKVRDMEDYDTKEERTAATDLVYGTGKASVNIYGGTVHRVFGGSNTKGNVRLTAVTMLDEAGGCDFYVDEAYGGGKSAEMDAEAQLLMACIPGLKAVYGGAEAADVRGNVTLNITNGTFDRVFGGNNMSGTIGGAITINVEEIGCRPVIIGELYGGGNQAAYSVYGYDSNGKAIESGTTPIYDDPQVNVMSFTSIGQIFGGGFGDGATLVGNPTVNVNVAYGRYNDENVSIVDEDAETPNHYPIPSHAKGKMGAINNVFGGGNAAKVIGNTNVNIATLSEVYVVKQVSVGDDVSSLYTRNNNGTYSAASGTATDGITYYEKKDVQGVDIRGNVYGGGNNAEVTGDSKVKIGKKVVGE